MPKLCGGEGQWVFLPWWNIQPGLWRIVLQGHIPLMTETESNIVWELLTASESGIKSMCDNTSVYMDR